MVTPYGLRTMGTSIKLLDSDSNPEYVINTLPKGFRGAPVPYSGSGGVCSMGPCLVYGTKGVYIVGIRIPDQGSLLRAHGLDDT